MQWYDWTVFLTFLAYVVFDGVRRSRGTKDIEGYFAGNRSIPWWAAGLSVMATQASAITVIGTTGQGHEFGMEFVQAYFGLPFAMVLICLFLIPHLRQSPILTAYEFLERRLGPGTRTIASVIFLLSRCLAFGVVIYAPAVVLAAMTGWDVGLTVLLIGGLTTGYTFFGGVNAVIWTDVKQMTVILFGIFLSLGIVLWHVLSQLGPGEALEAMGAASRLNVVEPTAVSGDLLPRMKGPDGLPVAGPSSFWEDRYNLWSGLFGGLFLHLAYFGCDQSQVQRILTNPTADESRKALLMSAIAKIPMQLVVLFLGVSLWLFHVVVGQPLLFNASAEKLGADLPAVQAVEAGYEAAQAQRREALLALVRAGGVPADHPEALQEFREANAAVESMRREARLEVARAEARLRGESEESIASVGEVRDTNYIFPQWILNYLPPILLGLVVAAIFAAAMSSADSALNSLAAASIVDVYKRWLRPGATDAQQLFASRVMTLFWGVMATGAALMFEGQGSVIELINRVGSYFYGSLLGAFALAILVPRARELAGVCGIVASMVAVLLVDQNLVVGFLWYNVIGAVAVLAVGVPLALLRRPDPA